MKLISQVLIESQKTRKQITGSLFGINPTKVSDIKEYCALGTLYCEAGLIDDGQDGHIVQSKGRTELMKYYLGNYEKSKIDHGDCMACVTTEITYQEYKSYSKEHPYEIHELADYIVHMNDYHVMSFEEIGRVLEKLGF